MKRLALLIIFVAGLVAALTPVYAAPSTEDAPKIAVYVTGGKSTSENRVLGTFILDALIRSGKYVAVERSDEFASQIDREQTRQRSGAIDDNQISRMGMQAGVQYICVVNMECAFSACMMSARIIDVETAKVITMAAAEKGLGSMGAIRKAANGIVESMLGTKLSAGKKLTSADAAGLRWGIWDGVLLPEAYFRMNVGRNNRIYMAFGWCSGKNDFTLEGSDKTFEYRANEFRATGFWEWQGAAGPLFKWHAGPGGSLGLYNYNYYHNNDFLYGETAFGIEAGAQIGGELRWRMLTISADVRPVFYYTLFPDANKDPASGVTATVGLGVGYAF